ncbi:MAG: SH3 domain-containing protein [Chloroflexi bacterium]|nr:SH3 domain-containing protein [Chloroflexota bacterium]
MNMRSDPSATATLLRTLANGTRLTAIGAANPPDAGGVAWQNVRTDEGQSGWVAAQFLIETKPVAVSPTATPPALPPAPGTTPVVTPIAASGYIYVAAPDGLNLRADKSASSQLLTILANGQRLKTNGLGFGPDSSGITWLNVETEAGVQGWVAKQFISDQVPSVAPAAPFANEADIAAEILRRTNEFRQEKSLPPLVLNDDLSRLALAHSAYMSQAGVKHESADNLTAKQRISNAGYGAAWPVENIYYSSEPGALDDAWGYWTTDLDHLNNLLTDRNTVIGIGVFKVGQKVYMTQDFGKPAQ